MKVKERWGDFKSSPRSPASSLQGRLRCVPRQSAQGLIDHLCFALYGEAAIPAKETEELFRACAFSAGSAWEFSDFYLASQVFSKFDDGDRETVIQKTDECFTALGQTESLCRELNKAGVWQGLSLPADIITTARRLIREAIGVAPSPEQLAKSVRFGPGATTSLKRRDASLQNKWGLSTHTTAGCYPYVRAYEKWSGWNFPTLEIVAGNWITTVNKNRYKRRSIAIEPDLNMLFQLGTGQLLKHGAHSVGLLHRDAQDRHKYLAHTGSLMGLFATLDLKSASDLVWYYLVVALFPEAWVKLFTDLRSEYGYIAEWGVLHRWEKLSSMGNGFTFEVETLLFWALTAATCAVNGYVLGAGNTVSVFGDDIVCPAQAAPAVIETLSAVGLTTNPDKSFYTGNFRESCGGHYYSGQDVTPFYVKQTPETWGEMINIANQLQGWMARNGSSPGLYDVLKYARSVIPSRLHGPWGVPGCLWSPPEICLLRRHKRNNHYLQRTVRRLTTKEYQCAEDDGKPMWAHDGPLRAHLHKWNDEAQYEFTTSLTSFEVETPVVCYAPQYNAYPVELCQ